MRSALSTALYFTVALVASPAAGDNVPIQPTARLRQPVGIAVVDRHAYVANRAAGTVSILDLKTNAIDGEVSVAHRLSGFVALPGTRYLLALDDKLHQLILLHATEAKLRVVRRFDVPHTPVNLSLSADGDLCAVASLWARQITLFNVEESMPEAQGAEPATTLTLRRTIDTPFAPRELKFLPQSAHLLVADAFGGEMAVVDIVTGKLLSRPSIHGHNIRGLTLDGSELLVTHQLLDVNSTTTHENVFWGSVMRNIVRTMPLGELLKPVKAISPFDVSTYPLGHPSGATGDPGAIAVTSRGETALLLSGINEIALRRRPREPFVRRDVGRRPSALALSDDERTLYVANTDDDSISIVDLATLKVTGNVSLGPQPELTAAQRGERLFFDARLSLDGWYSCHSCHTDGHSNGLLNDNFGDNYFGDAKRIPSLLGAGDTQPWAWNGKTASLKEQVIKSITVTMQGEKPEKQTVNDLVAYLKTLQPPPGINAARGTVDENLARTGKQLFQQHGCTNCHAPPTYTIGAVFDVGLADKSGQKEFNPPSLRGVSQRGSYFHDGRANSLREVLTTYGHNLEEPLQNAELQAMLEFLHSL